jgi:thymidylate kinase
VLKRFKDRITIIDASKSKEEVIDASMKEILKLINDQRTA